MSGGVVPNGGEGDRIPAWLAADEHVWTLEQIQRWYGPSGVWRPRPGSDPKAP